ncbi:hypothetical protein F511_24345 [Dorcoceras hygrometricum]|uniref:Uncharacterized protein n=1 Tax=Dorcoceras hygrometricum TaxID=472368 RepID=A0A2Z7D7L3_9LAMI|nr:hypothetical protein F511_24345 [Dorcoceras hygrometricum]
MLISSGLLVQPDEGVSDLVVDRIGVSTAIYREEPATSKFSAASLLFFISFYNRYDDVTVAATSFLNRYDDVMVAATSFFQ